MYSGVITEREKERGARERMRANEIMITFSS